MQTGSMKLSCSAERPGGRKTWAAAGGSAAWPLVTKGNEKQEGEPGFVAATIVSCVMAPLLSLLMIKMLQVSVILYSKS